MVQYSSYSKYVNFINKYKKASNASSGSEVDANANVENKNIATMQGELPKRDLIGTNRLLMWNKISKMFGEDIADEYIRQLESHEIYKHDETSVMPYCVSVTMYPFLFEGLQSIGGLSDAPTNLDSFCGSFINLVFAVASQFAGAVSTPEFLTYLDYFIRKEYGDDYYINSEKVVSSGSRPKTIDKVITDKFSQVVYSLNQPAAARNFQSVFWNIAYFDKNYFDGIFHEFIFPDDTEPPWASVNWLQKRFMKWFNAERLKKPLTFPVETVNLLDDGKSYVDDEWFNFSAEMYAEGHSFFTYRSGSVDSLASCCFDGKQMTLSKSSNGVNFMTFKELYESNYNDTKKHFTVFHNGSWVKGKVIKVPKKDMYKITTSNKKDLYVTEDHLHPTLRGDVLTKDLTVNDYLLANNLPLSTFPEKDKGLTYEQGILIGMYLGDGSITESKTCESATINYSLNESKYGQSCELMQKALVQLGIEAEIHLSNPQHNTYPVKIFSLELRDFIREYVLGRYSQEKELNLNCLLQSQEFRKGILDGYYLTDGGNSNRIYTTSPKLVEQIETLITSLGLNSIIDVTDRTDEPVVIRGESYNRNFPLYCIRWYEPKNKRSMANVFVVRNNCIYFKIKSIEKIETDDEYVYCFEMPEDEPYFTLPNGIITHNCRLRNELQDNTFSFTLGAGGVSTGSKGVITININRLVQNATRSGKDISEAVTEQVKKVHCYLKAFNEIMKDNFNSRLLPVYDAGYISLEKQFLTLGVNGFVEGAQFLDIPITPNDEYFDYCEKILKPIYELNKAERTDEIIFNTEFVPKMSGHKVA